MAVDRYKHFRWTPRTAWLTIAYVVVFPSIIGFIGYKYEVGTLMQTPAMALFR